MDRGQEGPAERETDGGCATSARHGAGEDVDPEVAILYNKYTAECSDGRATMTGTRGQKGGGGGRRGEAEEPGQAGKEREEGRQRRGATEARGRATRGGAHGARDGGRVYAQANMLLAAAEWAPTPAQHRDMCRLVTGAGGGHGDHSACPRPAAVEAMKWLRGQEHTGLHAAFARTLAEGSAPPHREGVRIPLRGTGLRGGMDTGYESRGGQRQGEDSGGEGGDAGPSDGSSPSDHSSCDRYWAEESRLMRQRESGGGEGGDAEASAGSSPSNDS